MTTTPTPGGGSVFDAQLDALIADLTTPTGQPTGQAVSSAELRYPPAPSTLPPPEPTIEIAHPDQIEDVLAVLNSAAARLVAQGIDQWPATFTEDGWRADRLRAEAEQGHVVLVRFGHVPVATATITTWADPDFVHAWPAGTVDDAMYVLRLARTDTAHKVGVRGSWLLDYATQVAMLRGRGRVRLDCSRTNTKLHDYYLRQGFKPMGVVKCIDQHTGNPRRSGALFERPVPAVKPEEDWT